MEKIDRIVQNIREMMVTGAAGSSAPAFSGQSPAAGPTAGTDPRIKFMRRGKLDYRKVPQSYKNWVKNLENK